MNGVQELFLKVTAIESSLSFEPYSLPEDARRLIESGTRDDIKTYAFLLKRMCTKLMQGDQTSLARANEKLSTRQADLVEIARWRLRNPVPGDQDAITLRRTLIALTDFFHDVIFASQGPSRKS